MVFSVQAFVSWLISIIQLYGPLSVFVGIIIEEIIVPIPSPLIPMAAGFILIPANISLADASVRIFFTIVIPGAIATAIGSMVIYAVGYYGGHGAVKRFGRFLGTTVGEIEKTSKKMHSKRVWISIVVLRAIPIFPTSVVTLACGVMRLNVKKYFLSTVIGAIPRIFILSFIGWQIGESYTILAENFGKIEDILLGLIVVIVIIAIILYIRRRRKRK